MMFGNGKRVWIWVVLTLLAACGGEEQKPTAPQQSPPSQPSYGPPSGSKWSAEEYANALNRCTQAGQERLKWDATKAKNYCHCVYSVAAGRWALRDFAQQFDTYYNQLRQDGTISNCLKSAGLDGSSD